MKMCFIDDSIDYIVYYKFKNNYFQIPQQLFKML